MVKTKTTLKPRRNKTLLQIISIIPIGFMGFDRLYMGCYKTFALKLSLCLAAGIFFLLAISLNPAFAVGTAVCLGIAFFFYLFDALWVFFNAITRSRDTPLCDGYQWEGEKDIRVAQVVGGLCLLLVSVGIALGYGPFWFWNWLVKKTGFSSSP